MSYQLRLRRSWTGKLILQIKNAYWSDWYGKYITTWRDATAVDILSGEISNVKLFERVPSDNA